MSSSSYLYSVRMPLTAVTIAKTLVQIKPVTASIQVIKARVFQTTKTASELLDIQQSVWSGAFTAGTVTSATPTKKGGRNDPASLAVGGTAATGVNATVEPTGGTQDIVDEDVWNLINGTWSDVPIPEDRIMASNAELYTLKLNTAPAASTTLGVVVDFLEFR